MVQSTIPFVTLLSSLLILLLASSSCQAFTTAGRVTTTTVAPLTQLSAWRRHKDASSSSRRARVWDRLSPATHFQQQQQQLNNNNQNQNQNNNNNNNNNNIVLMAGLLGPIKKVHNPVTYLVLSLMAGFRWSWCFRSPLYWFGVGFCVKWYRARYVFRIPVWDRQPNWNNVITSKDQEKDLKAITCKNCGSTLFIAKTREFFFEGQTGLAGLGCFSCGVKGADNFIMDDRDRIVEDVGDMDDYFEYERPLDFVSRSERRKLMKEAAGDEDKANQLLMEQQAAAAGTTEQPQQQEEATTTTTNDIVDAEIVAPEEEAVADEEEAVAEEAVAEEEAVEEDEPAATTATTNDDDPTEEPTDEPQAAADLGVTITKISPSIRLPAPPAQPRRIDDDDLGVLEMDL